MGLTSTAASTGRLLALRLQPDRERERRVSRVRRSDTLCRQGREGELLTEQDESPTSALLPIQPQRASQRANGGNVRGLHPGRRSG